MKGCNSGETDSAGEGMGVELVFSRTRAEKHEAGDGDFRMGSNNAGPGKQKLSASCSCNVLGCFFCFLFLCTVMNSQFM